ncbi:MAG: A/G-specific adenine glycosylase [Desulfobulbaceae bacterium]|uniref:Adenine DNA glycosylase n=1 Tax=Candidatus Desulfobia pelagia TaxID=2841692 RepID=A0A8J6NAF9_9BACT|nr:A/G-specific adenine glycosylase [Candidatus Desulfobia pelagia]
MSPSDFSRKLLAWYGKNRRDLPWRKTKDPYSILVSEIMLQQTQVDRVKEYYLRWIHEFPDISSLASADEEKVLTLWEGLGYYSRARNLHKTSIQLNSTGKNVPDSIEGLTSLPGIGPYTAAAVMSIAFNRDEPLVDANVERVFSRFFDVNHPVKSREAQDIFWKKAKQLLPSGQAGEYNQALMELGALICLKTNPLCDSCPVQDGCKALNLGLIDQRPISAPSKKTIQINMACGVLKKNGLFFIQKRQENDVWAGLWEFPGGRLKEDESPEKAVVREFMEETELAIHNVRPIATVKHSYMNYRVTLHGFFCDQYKKDQQPILHAAQDFRWVSAAELEEFAFPAGHRKLITLLKENAFTN